MIVTERRCDRDGAVNGSCTLGVQMCVGVPDPALACTFSIDAIHAYAEITKPSLVDAQRSPAAAAVRTQLGALEPLLHGAANTCTGRLDMVVPMHAGPSGFRKSKMALKTRAWLYPQQFDVDSLLLQCVP